MVLCKLEAKARRRLAVFVAIDEIDRTRVARRQAARLAENELEQPQQVALRGEGDGDPRELLQLAMPQCHVLARGARGGEGGRMAKGSAKGGDDRAHGRVG